MYLDSWSPADGALWKGRGASGGGASLEEVGHRGRALKFHGPANFLLIFYFLISGAM